MKRNLFIIVLLLTNISQTFAMDYFIEVNPQAFLYNGYGAAAGIETNHINFGVYGLSIDLPDEFRDEAFENAEHTEIQNSLLELGMNVFWNSNNHGLYLGVLYGPEWFTIKSKTSNESKSMMANYLAFKVGYKWFLTDLFYLDFGYGRGGRADGDSKVVIDSEKVELKSSIPVLFFSTGIRF
jgi:hypothetical protein